MAASDIDLDSNPREIAGTRIYDAPRALVFAAFTDPKHLEKWWGPNGFTITVHSFEFRAGGVWRFVMHGPDGRDYQNKVVFDEIVPDERLVYRHVGVEGHDPAHHRTVVTFADEGGKTRLTWRMTFPSAGERNRIAVEYGAVEGLQQTMSRLAGYVTQHNHNGG